MTKILIFMLFGVFAAVSSKVLVMLLGSGKRDERADSNAPEPSEHAELVGKKGTAATALRLSGFVAIDGKRLAATSDGNFIDAGEAIEVIGVKGNELVVRKTRAVRWRTV
jgi:membrane-bound ClpP family serine protease